MADQLLVNVLTVTVPANGTLTVEHGLKSNGKAVAPTLILPDGASPVAVTAATANAITLANAAGYAVTATFRVERGVSVEVAAGNLPLVKVGTSGGAATFGAANALKPTVFSGLHQMAWIPIYSYDGANPAQLIKLGVEGEESLYLCAGRKDAASDNDVAATLRLDRVSPSTGGVPAAALIAGNIAGGRQGGSIYIQGDAVLLPGTNLDGSSYDSVLYGSYAVASGRFNTTMISVAVAAGTPINPETSFLRLFSTPAVNMDGTTPQIRTTLPNGSTVRDGTRLTITKRGAGTLTLTNAAGGQLKLRSSPLVINQYEAYSFVFDDGFWIQCG